MAVKRICEVIVRDERSILPVSTAMTGAYGIDGVVLSMPCIVGKNAKRDIYFDRFIKQLRKVYFYKRECQ